MSAEPHVESIPTILCLTSEVGLLLVEWRCMWYWYVYKLKVQCLLRCCSLGAFCRECKAFLAYVGKCEEICRMAAPAILLF